jgi:hypothetical protein
MLNLKMQLEFKQHVCEAKLCSMVRPDNVPQVGFMAKPLVVFERCLIKVIAVTLAALSEVSHSFKHSSAHKSVQYIYCSPHAGICCRLLLSQVLLLRSKTWKSQGSTPSVGLVTGFRTTAGRLQMNMPTAQVSYPVIYIYFEPSRST